MSGILSEWTREQYEADTERVRSTRLKDIMAPQGPRHYYLMHVATEPKQQPPSTIQPKVDDKVLGQLFHEYVLEERQDWFVCSSRYNSRAWFDAIEENNGKWALKPDQHDQLMRMAEGLWRNPLARELVTDNGFAEQTFLWTDPETGILAKARVDLFANDGTIVDLKTTRASDRHGFDKQIRQLKYHLSAAFYEQGRNAVPQFDGMRADFIHIAVSKSYPHYCYVWKLDRHYLMAGHRDVTAAFARLKACLDRQEDGAEPLDAWPDLLERSQDQTLAPPEWWLSDSGWAPEDV